MKIGLKIYNQKTNLYSIDYKIMFLARVYVWICVSHTISAFICVCCHQESRMNIQIQYSYALCCYIPIRYSNFLYIMEILQEPFYEYHTKCLHNRAQKESNKLQFIIDFLAIIFLACLDCCRHNKIYIIFF